MPLILEGTALRPGALCQQRSVEGSYPSSPRSYGVLSDLGKSINKGPAAASNVCVPRSLSSERYFPRDLVLI